MAPAMGVPNTDANPALMPQITSFFLSSFDNLNKSEKADAKLAPIWAEGPSLPTDPPNAMVAMVDIAFIGTTRKRIFPLNL